MKIQPEQRYQSAGHGPHRSACDVLAELEGRGQAGSRGRPRSKPRNGKPALPTILCIEHRLKQQDMIRDYLTQRGFRVLLFNNVHRAISRAALEPARLRRADWRLDRRRNWSAAYDQMRELNRDRLSISPCWPNGRRNSSKNSNRLRLSRVMQQPITLRELRREIHLLFQRKMKTHSRPSLSS